jgi:hypothetical protein
VCEGRAKYEGAVPARVPRKAVVGTGEGETELAGGMTWVGGEVEGEAVKARPIGSGRHGWRRLRVISAWGRRRSQRSSG